MNRNSYETQSEFLKAISHPTRLAILDILRDGEQCVCHMEATLELRQAYISQQLMILKDAGLVESRRDGLNLYYRVVKPKIFDELVAKYPLKAQTAKSVAYEYYNPTVRGEAKPIGLVVTK